MIPATMHPHYAPWNPETEKDRETVHTALDEVLQSSQFRNSKRYPALLTYLVEEVLAGRTEEIKERTLGVEVFGRPPDYDTNTDTAVRYTAGEIRKRLALYYHEHPDSRLQIALTTRSYVPEFLQLIAASSSSEALPDSGKASEKHPSVPTGFTHYREIAFALAGILLCIGMATAVSALWHVWRPDAVRSFWAPYLQPSRIALICPGGNVFDPAASVNPQPADQTTRTPYLSFGNGLALGRVASIISSRGGSYRVEAAASTSLSRLSEGPAILVGAYNNPWTERLLLPLRFHFGPEDQKGIVDSEHPEKRWVHDARDIDNSPDYALVARFNCRSTGNMIVVVAGLKRFGTDAASQFVSSDVGLRQLDARLGTGWRTRNVEVVLKADVADGRVGAPQIEDAATW